MELVAADISTVEVLGGDKRSVFDGGFDKDGFAGRVGPKLCFEETSKRETANTHNYVVQSYEGLPIWYYPCGGLELVSCPWRDCWVVRKPAFIFIHGGLVIQDMVGVLYKCCLQSTARFAPQCQKYTLFDQRRSSPLRTGPDVFSFSAPPLSCHQPSPLEFFLLGIELLFGLSSRHHEIGHSWQLLRPVPSRIATFQA